MDNIKAYMETKDKSFLHKWVEENTSLLHSIVHRTIKRHQFYSIDAEDLFSDAIVFFYQVVDGYDPARGRFSTYLYRALDNELTNHCKHLIRSDFGGRVHTVNIDALIDMGDGEGVSVEQILTNTDEEENMRRALIASLDEFVDKNYDDKIRSVYRLYSQGYPIVEIAKTLGVSKQYISSVIINLASEVRKEWRVHG